MALSLQDQRPWLRTRGVTTLRPMSTTVRGRSPRQPMWSVVLPTVILALLCAPLVLSAPPTGASPTKLTVATGSITCRQLTGTITYTPPLHFEGQTDDDTRHLAARQRLHHTQVHRCRREQWRRHLHGPLRSQRLLRWGRACPKRHRDVATRPGSPLDPANGGFARRANGGAKGLVYASTPGRQQVIVIPQEGKTVSVKGSFAGKASYAIQENLHGSIMAYSDLITGQPDAACKSRAGLSVTNIVSGVETLP